MDLRPCQRSRKEGEQERLHGLNASIGCTELAGARQDNGIRQQVPVDVHIALHVAEEVGATRVNVKLLSSRNSFLITPTPGWDQEEAIRPLAKTRGKRAANRWQSTRLHN